MLLGRRNAFISSRGARRIAVTALGNYDSPSCLFLGLSLMCLLSSCASVLGSAAAPIACPKPGTIGYAALDVSGSARGGAVLADHLAMVRQSATHAASCGGRLRVVAFSSSVAATEPLLDSVLALRGATDIARRRKLPKVVDEAMRTIQSNLTTALKALPGGGTDIAAQLTQAAEFWDELGRSHPLEIMIATDGIATAGVDFDSDLSPAAATNLATGPSVPTLKGAQITFAGIGKQAGAPPSTRFVDALKAYWRIVCRRTGATCRVVTDLSAGV